jgi:hypothetical protein
MMVMVTSRAVCLLERQVGVANEGHRQALLAERLQDGVLLEEVEALGLDC